MAKEQAQNRALRHQKDALESKNLTYQLKLYELEQTIKYQVSSGQDSYEVVTLKKQLAAKNKIITHLSCQLEHSA